MKRRLPLIAAALLCFAIAVAAEPPAQPTLVVTSPANVEESWIHALGPLARRFELRHKNTSNNSSQPTAHRAAQPAASIELPRSTEDLQILVALFNQFMDAQAAIAASLPNR